MKKTLFAIVATWVMIGCASAPPPAPTPVPMVENDPPPPCVEEWVHMPVHLGFPSGGTELDAQNRVILAEVVRTAQHRDDILRVRVEGHTDTCGNEQSNMTLSQNRAISVANELVAVGVPREMIETLGFGSTQPMGVEHCGQGDQLTRQVNRRVEFTLLVCRR